MPLLREVRFERTHDLQWLAARATAAGLVTPVEDVQLAALNPYAVDMRYEASEVVWVSDEEIRAWVRLMQDWVDQLIHAAHHVPALKVPRPDDPI